MKHEVAMKWVASLRSELFNEGSRGLLMVIGKDTNYWNAMGVLCQISPIIGEWNEFGAFVTKNSSDSFFIPDSVRVWAGLRDKRGSYKGQSGSIKSIDEYCIVGTPFSEIADFIEKYYEAL